MADAGTMRLDLATAPAQATGDQARLRALAQRSGGHGREDLARAAREFEGVFLDILVKSMRATVPENGLMGSGGATQIYRQMHDTELARALAGTGEGLGIARLLEQQFAEQFAEDEAGGDLEVPAALGPERPAGPPLPAALAMARYRRTATPPAVATPRVQDLGELPGAAPIAAMPAAAPRVEAAPAATSPVRTPAAPSATAAERPAEAPAGAAADRRPARPALLPVDRSLVAAPLRPAEADTVRRFGPQIENAAGAAGLDPRLVLAVVMEESGGDPAARSRAGARGLMQLMPGTAAGLGVTDPLDPEQNLDGGTRYLSQMLDRYDGNVQLALAAYNAGPGNVDKYGGIPPFAETQRYVPKIMNYYQQIVRDRVGASATDWSA